MRQKIRIFGYTSPLIIILGLGVYYINGLWDLLSVGISVLGIIGAAVYLVLCFDEVRQLFSLRSFRSGTNAMLIVCLVLGLVALVNIIGFRHFAWKDITVAKKFELSPLTMTILDQISELKRDIYITAFFWREIDRNLSVEQNSRLIRQNQMREARLRDLLAVYSGVNPHINYRFIDPNREPMLARQYNTQRYYNNVAIVECGERMEMVPDVSTEEQVTNTLIKVLSGEIKRVYFLEGHQERGADDGSGEGCLMAATGIRDQSYDVVGLNLLEAGGVPADCRALVIPGPRKELLPDEVRLIDDYLEDGGRVLVCLDPEYNTGLEEWLLGWGVQAGDNMVIDNSTAGVRQGAGPEEPLLYSYDEEHPITARLMKAFTSMPTVRSVGLVEEPREELELTVLARTSENSWGETKLSSLAVKNPTFDPEDLSGPVPVAVAMLKKLLEKKPGIQEVYSGPGGRAPSQEELQKMRLEQSQRRAELVVFGDSRFASNDYFRYGGNRDLFLNAVNWLIGDERLITIRPKDPEDQTVYITRRQSKRMALVLQYLLTSVVLLFGAWVWIMRRR
ncbi:MAG: GldG family protein [Candidatus Glassbacteria bacterium]|nr:GldG family protein [Candidatus Glassbacteria bacterium]